MKTKTKWHIEPLGARFCIRNSITGAYIHRHIMGRPLLFPTREAAIVYMVKHDLNREIYYTEAVK